MNYKRQTKTFASKGQAPLATDLMVRRRNYLCQSCSYLQSSLPIFFCGPLLLYIWLRQIGHLSLRFLPVSSCTLDLRNYFFLPRSASKMPSTRIACTSFLVLFSVSFRFHRPFSVAYDQNIGLKETSRLNHPEFLCGQISFVVDEADGLCWNMKSS